MKTYELSKINTVEIEQFQNWTDKYGMMQDNPNGLSTGNGNLFTAHYVFGLSQNGLLTDEAKDRLNQVFRNNFREPGLLMRTPNNEVGYQAHDDFVGMFGADAILNPESREFTRAAYDYGHDKPAIAADISDSNIGKNKLQGDILASSHYVRRHPKMGME